MQTFLRHSRPLSPYHSDPHLCFFPCRLSTDSDQQMQKLGLQLPTAQAAFCKELEGFLQLLHP
jgi:hypothetical protein